MPLTQYKFVLVVVCWSLALPCVASGLLHDAVESAWNSQPEANGQTARQNELSARRDVADSWLSQAPSLSIGHQSDRLNRNFGARQWELELGLPLWQSGEQQHQRAAVDADRAAYGASLGEIKWRIAGDVREAYWRFRLAESEVFIAARRLRDANALSEDVARRVQAGTSARVDLNLARIATQTAQLAVTQTDLALQRTRREWSVLTKQMPLPESLPSEVAASTAAVEHHPTLLALLSRIVAARARLGVIGVTGKGTPELTLAITRERRDNLEPYDNQLSIKLKIPLGSDARNQPRLAAVNAELIEAESALALARTRLDAEIETSRTEQQAAQIAVGLALERQRLALDNYVLLDKAFQLGQIDFATRLRANADYFQAESELGRARIEAAHAISRLNQAQGILP